MARKPITKPGVQERQELPPEENPNYCLMKVSSAGSLKALAQEYVLFTHGLLFTHGRWTSDPISDYVVEYSPQNAPFVIELPKRAFSNMECRDERRRLRSEWCYKLLAIKKEGWGELFAFMSTVGAIDRDRGYFARLLAQVVPVPDLFILERLTVLPPRCPLADVVVFGIDSNQQAVYCHPAKNPPLDKPKVITAGPDPETTELAEQILQEQPEPYAPIDHRIFQAKLRLASAESQLSKIYL